MTLSQEDGQLYYRLWLPLLDYVNGKYRVKRKLKSMATAKELAPADVKAVANKLWSEVTIIDDYLKENDHFGLDIRISDESDALLETGGGIKKALPLFENDSPILIHNVDILSNVNLARLYDFAASTAAADAAIDALLLVSRRKTKRYLLFDDEMILRGWTNIETGEVRGEKREEFRLLAFSGIHVMGPKAFPYFKEMPERFGIIDFYLKYCQQCSFLGCEKSDLRLLDVGKLDSLEQAELYISNM